MAERLPSTETAYDVVCPHCSRRFRAMLLSGSAARYQGFKCPKCKLFVPLERGTPGNGDGAA